MRAKSAEKVSRPNLADVARNAGVSPSTVSLVLAGKAKERYISDEVILRVQRAAALLDYSPNMLIRSMQRGRTNILSFYNCFRYGQIATDLYTVGLFSATAQAAGDHGCNLLLFCDFSLTPDETYHALKGGHSDGVIIFAPQPNDPLLPFLRSSRLPAILLNSEDEEGALSSVKDDMASGIHMVAKQLINLGHKNVAMLTQAGTMNSDGPKRVALLSTLLAEAGIAVPDERIVPVTFAPTDVLGAIKHIRDNMKEVTAVFCWDDYVGYLALDACDDLGVSVPDQLSLIGYDGIAWPSRSRHTLTSVDVDLVKLGQVAVDTLAKLAYGEESGPINITLPVTFTNGTTVAPAIGV